MTTVNGKSFKFTPTNYVQRNKRSFFNISMEKIFFILTNKCRNKLSYKNEVRGPRPQPRFGVKPFSTFTHQK